MTIQKTAIKIHTFIFDGYKYTSAHDSPQPPPYQGISKGMKYFTIKELILLHNQF